MPADRSDEYACPKCSDMNVWIRYDLGSGDTLGWKCETCGQMGRSEKELLVIA